MSGKTIPALYEDSYYDTVVGNS